MNFLKIKDTDISGDVYIPETSIRFIVKREDDYIIEIVEKMFDSHFRRFKTTKIEIVNVSVL